MRHKEIEFTVEQASKRDDVWVWRFSIGGEVRTGKTVTKLELLAIRRVQFIIDRELRKRNVPSQRATDGDKARDYPRLAASRTRSHPPQAIGAERLVIVIAYNFRKLVRLTF